MLFRWRDPTNPLPDEDAFEAIKAGVDAMPVGVKMMLNSGNVTPNPVPRTAELTQDLPMARRRILRPQRLDREPRAALTFLRKVP